MYIKIPFDILEKMPIKDRKYYIYKYNEYMEARNVALEGNSTSTTTDISMFTNLSQGVTGEEVFE